MTHTRILLRLVITTVWLALLTAASYAGTLQNYDAEEYRIEARHANGEVAQKIIPGNASVPGLCSFDGCELRLTSTGQTISMGPNDHVVIMNGKMRVREPLFRSQ